MYEQLCLKIYNSKSGLLIANVDSLYGPLDQDNNNSFLIIQ
jgi:hypothetical protein